MVIFQYNLYIFEIHLWTVLYPKPCYNEPCYKEVVVYGCNCDVAIQINVFLYFLKQIIHYLEGSHKIHKN